MTNKPKFLFGKVIALPMMFYDTDEKTLAVDLKVWQVTSKVYIIELQALVNGKCTYTYRGTVKAASRERDE